MGAAMSRNARAPRHDRRRPSSSTGEEVMGEKRIPFRTAAFTLTSGQDEDQWTLQINGVFSLWEIPKLKELLDIYATLAEAPKPRQQDETAAQDPRP
jgi:hypothetical protein